MRSGAARIRRAVARHPLPPLMKAFQDLDFRGGPIKSIFWTISLLAPRAEFGSVGHTAPNRIHWAASWHGGTVASVCCISETANMAVFGRFVSISREKRPKTAKTSAHGCRPRRVPHEPATPRTGCWVCSDPCVGAVAVEVSRGAFLGWVVWMPIIGQKWPCNGTMWSILYLSSNVNIASVPLSTSRRGESAGVVCTMHGFAAPLGKQGPSLTGKRSITVQIARLPN